LDYPGAWHHVMNRAARRAALFGDDEHAGTFLSALADVVFRFDVEVHAYAMMPNHYHLLVRSVRGNLSRAMKHLGMHVTRDINRLHRWDGPLFRGRYRSELITDDAYLLTVAAYIHLNPVRAGLARRLDQHCWSSHRGYLGLDVPPEWLSWEFVTNVAGGRKAFAAYVGDLRVGARAWPPDFDLKQGMRSSIAADAIKVRQRSNLRDRKSHVNRSVERLLAEVLAITGARRGDLTRCVRGPGGNRVRRFAAWVLSVESDLTQSQIGKALDMSENHVCQMLCRMATSQLEPMKGWMRRWLEKQASSDDNAEHCKLA
jgi:putative transposase